VLPAVGGGRGRPFLGCMGDFLAPVPEDKQVGWGKREGKKERSEHWVSRRCRRQQPEPNTRPGISEVCLNWERGAA
jgi:hypothetical protein